MTVAFLALDPGKTTGAAWRDSIDPQGAIDTCDVTGNELDLWNFMGRKMPRVVVYESFLWQQRHEVNFSPVYNIGVIRVWCQLNNVPYFEQTPAGGKGFWIDKLAPVGLYVVGSQHRRDATAHLLHFLTLNPAGPHERYWIEQLHKAGVGR